MENKANEISMQQHYMGMEAKLKEMENALKEAETKIDEFLAKASDAEAEMRKWQAEAEKAEAENARLKNNVIYMRNVMENFAKCDFAPSEEELKKEKQEQVKKEELARAKVKDFNPAKSWTRRKGEIGQFKPDGTIMNSWTSQRSAAESLRWSQTGVGKFMKLDHATQVCRKGFYLEYMGR